MQTGLNPSRWLLWVELREWSRFCLTFGQWWMYQCAELAQFYSSCTLHVSNFYWRSSKLCIHKLVHSFYFCWAQSGLLLSWEPHFGSDWILPFSIWNSTQSGQFGRDSQLWDQHEEGNSSWRHSLQVSSTLLVRSCFSMLLFALLKLFYFKLHPQISF